MMENKRRWVVETDREVLGVTDDLGKAEKALRAQYEKDFPGTDGEGLLFDIKFMDWYLFGPLGNCLWNYRAQKTEEL